MDIVGEQKVWSFDEPDNRAKALKCIKIRNNPAVTVGSFMELAKKVAELQFLNRDYVLLFRGQDRDHLTSQGNTSLRHPSYSDQMMDNRSLLQTRCRRVFGSSGKPRRNSSADIAAGAMRWND
jgi:hypothetical protein